MIGILRPEQRFPSGAIVEWMGRSGIIGLHVVVVTQGKLVSSRFPSQKLSISASAQIVLRRDNMFQMRDTDSGSGFERSLPFKFPSLMMELGASVAQGGRGIVAYRGFKAIATLSFADAEALTSADETALKRAFSNWGN